MKLSEADRELLESIATDRMDQHIAAHRQEAKADLEILNKRAEVYWEVLDKLEDEDANAIHDYHDHSYWMAANEEKMLYKCGVLDGLRIAKCILEL